MKHRLIVCITFLLMSVTIASAQDTAQSGLILNTDAATEGYTLFSPMQDTKTYLIDNDGRLIQSWVSDYQPALSAYLLENGHLLRTASLRSDRFQAGGVGGRVEEFDWNGNLIWSFEYASDSYYLHHDIEPLPNGNILMVAWNYLSADEAIALGRDANLLPDGSASGNRPGQSGQQNQDPAIWADSIIEVNPQTNEIVWEWRVTDHLVQDIDSAKPNYGNVSEHPERININYTSGRVVDDWTHINSVDYNADLDQIVLSVHGFSEIWILDHSISSAEAAGQAGDLLYRWGNPQAYDGNGTQQLFVQHDAQWTTTGSITIFNNGDRRQRAYSTVVEIMPPVDSNGIYAGSGPDAPFWIYQANPVESFYATNISGAQRLENGNTLVTDGPAGTFFEVTLTGEIVWEYVNPIFSRRRDEVANEVFRATRYAPDYAGLASYDLTLGATIDTVINELAAPNGRNN